MSDLPPLDQPQAYIVVGPNDQRGPYTLDLLIGEVVAGRLHDATPIWWPGLGEWTTMNADPGVAAEVARRRAVPVDTMPVAPVAPAPATDPYAQQAVAQPEAAPQQTYDPGQYQAAQTEAAQYETAQYETAQYQAAEPVAANYGQDYSYDASAGVAVTGDAAQVVSEVPAEPAAAVPSGWTVTDTSTPAEAPVMADAVIADAAAVEADATPAEAPADEAPAAEAPADQANAEAERVSSVTDEHRTLFAGVVGRSTERAAAGDRVSAVDVAVADAVVAGAESQGFSATDRTTGETNHDLRFDGGAGETLSITLGRIKGNDPAAVLSDHAPLTVRFQAASYAGGLDAGTGEHGEVIVVADEWSGQHTSTVALLLTLGDYLSPDLDVDSAALAGDVAAIVAIVSDRLR